MSTSLDGAIESPPCVNNDAVRDDPGFIDGGGDSDPRPVSDASVPESRVSVADGDGSVHPTDNSDNSRGQSTSKKKTNGKKVNSGVEDYDSILSEFDMFAAKRVGEAVGYGYEFGDMVWGKVKSHPWWPGYIYNEAFASSAVKRSKRKGHELVAFFGDSSYGWFELAELIPFEENFAEKSQQTSSRSFVKAVEEAVDVFSRRRILGLACRCRNQFNFWPSNVDGYFVVDVGDSEPEVYSSSQINKARENFQPKEMLSFVQQLALTPMTDQQGTIEFIKNKAIVLGCRKALFEEFDETYAQAFGTIPVRPDSPTMPVALNPAKAPLRGPLVMAEALGKGKVSKPTKAKGRAEKDKYVFKRREESIPTNIKRASSEEQSSYSLQPLMVDASALSGAPTDSVVQDHTARLASSISDIKPSEGSRKIVEDGMKKAKVQKQQAAKLSAENSPKKKKKRKKDPNTEQLAGESNSESVDKKRKMEVKAEAGNGIVQLLPANSSSGVAVATAKSEHDILKKDVDTVSSSLPIEPVNAELSVLVRDLHGLALNPSHGAARGCPSSVPLVFLKFRSLVFQKSLALFPSESEKTDARTSSVLSSSSAKTGHKAKPLLRLDDPTKGGKKRSPPDHPKPIKKKKLVPPSDDIDKKKKPIDPDGGVTKKKKIIVNSVEKRIPNSSSLPKPPNPQPSKKIGRIPSNPTMLVMKFPSGAALPSSAELRAKFARFGPMDHSATRVFWKTYTCRLVFRQKVDAQSALNFAISSTILFGNTNVRSYIREVEAEEQQLKSCLKKPNEEGGNGIGNGRGTRVKFEQVSSVAENNNPSSSSTYAQQQSMDFSSNKLPKLIQESSNIGQFHHHNHLKTSGELLQQPQIGSGNNSNRHMMMMVNKPTPNSDISQQFINLLRRCNDVVNNITGLLGYVPYHAI